MCIVETLVYGLEILVREDTQFMLENYLRLLSSIYFLCPKYFFLKKNEFKSLFLMESSCSLEELL